MAKPKTAAPLLSQKTIDSMVALQSKAIFSVSPNGQFMAYRKVAGFRYQLWISDLKTSLDRMILESEFVLTMARFSPDSRFLGVFEDVSRKRQYQLVIFDLLKRSKPVHSSHLTYIPAVWWATAPTTRAFLLPFSGTRRTLGFIDPLHNEEYLVPTVPVTPEKIAVRTDGHELAFLGEKRVFTWTPESGSFRELSFSPQFRAAAVYALSESNDFLIEGITAQKKHFFLVSPNQKPNPFSIRVPDAIRKSYGMLEAVFPYSRSQMVLRVQQNGCHRLLLLRDQTVYPLDRHETGFSWPVLWGDAGQALYFTWQDHQHNSTFYSATLKNEKWVSEKIEHPVFKDIEHPQTFESILVKSDDKKSFLTSIRMACPDRKKKGALIYVAPQNDSSSVQDTFSPQLTVFTKLGWVVAAVADDEKSVDTNRAKDLVKRLQETIRYVADAYHISTNQMVLYGSSMGASVSFMHVLNSNKLFLGLVDIGGPMAFYTGLNCINASLEWIEAFQGKYDTQISDKPRYIRNCQAAIANANAALNLQNTVLEKEGHVIFFPKNWKLIYQTLVSRLETANLVDLECR